MISIVIPTYNSGQYLEDLFESILEQSKYPEQIVIKDCNSTDNTTDIIKKYTPLFIKKGIAVDFISNSDLGIYDAMNIAVAHCKADFTLFLGSDDKLFSNTALATFISFIKDKNSVYYANALFKNRNRIYDGRFTVFKLSKRNICHQAILYPTKLLRRYSYNTNFKLKADHDLNMKLWKIVSFRYSNFCFAIFNDNASSANLRDENFDKEKLLIVKKNLGQLAYMYSKSSLIIGNLLRRFMI